MGLLAVLLPVDELEQHGIGDVHSGELVEGAGRKEHLAAVVCLFTFWARQHGDGVAAKVLVEAPRHAAASELLVHGHGIVLFVEVGVELVGGEWGDSKVEGLLLPCWGRRLRARRRDPARESLLFDAT